jgi:hypothetical protein
MSISRGDFLAALAVCAHAQPKRPPNIVFILIDDYGWRDTGYNGSTFYKKIRGWRERQFEIGGRISGPGSALLLIRSATARRVFGAAMAYSFHNSSCKRPHLP